MYHLALCGKNSELFSFADAEIDHEIKRKFYDLIAVGFDTELLARPCSCTILLVPEGIKGIQYIQAVCAVSYGCISKNTITFSSVDEEKVSLTLQRSLMTLSGNLLDSQEFMLPKEKDELMEDFMFTAGVRLLTDIQ